MCDNFLGMKARVWLEIEEFSMETSKDYRAICQEARHLLLEGEAREAFQTFRQILNYPGMVSGAVEMAEALELFAEISQGMGGEELSQIIRSTAEQLDDPGVLYRLGYE